MVILHIKKGDESQFLYNTTVTLSIDEVIDDVINIYNGRLKISRICYEMEDLAKHGTQLPENMMGLTDEQISELKLKDEWGEKCIPSGGWSFNRDDIGRRNGHQPTEKIQEVINNSINEVKAMVSRKKTQTDICLMLKEVHEALDLLRGTVMIAYPMNLPPHDNIRMELENRENLEGTQASKEVIDLPSAQMWFSGKELERGKKLSDYLGKNDKTKIIVKITKKGSGPPARESVFSENERKLMMAHAYRKQEELKKLEQDADDEYLNRPWADSGYLKRHFQGLKNISWKPK